MIFFVEKRICTTHFPHHLPVGRRQTAVGVDSVYLLCISALRFSEKIVTYSNWVGHETLQYSSQSGSLGGSERISYS